MRPRAAPELLEGEAEEIERWAGLASLRDALGKELARLSDDQREALRLRVVEERPYTVGAQIKGSGKGCSFLLRGAISKDIAAGTVVEHDVWFPYRCHGTVQVDVGYDQLRKPTAMPFMAEGLANAKVGRAEAQVG